MASVQLLMGRFRKKHRRQAASHSPCLQQDLDITQSVTGLHAHAAMGTISVEADLLGARRARPSASHSQASCS